VLGSLKKSRNVKKLLQLFDPGNDTVERKPKPRRRRKTVDEDELYRKKLADKKKALLRQESEARKEAAALNELQLKKEQLKKRKKESPVIRRSESLNVKLRAVPKRQFSDSMLGLSVERNMFSELDNNFSILNEERMEVESPSTELPVQQQSPLIFVTDQDDSILENMTFDDTLPAHIESAQVQGLSQSLSSDPDQDSPRIDNCSLDCFSDDSAPPSPQYAPQPEPQSDKLDLLQMELDNLRQLMSGLKDRQSRTRKMLNSYRNRDYSFTGVYERARKLRRVKEDELWQMMQGSPSLGLQLQPSNFVGEEKSFLDELNEAGDFCWEGITFGESTDL